MAKGKTVKTKQTEAPEKEEVKNQENVAENPAPTPEQTETPEKEEETEVPSDKAGMPESVDKTLKSFPQYEKLYVGPFGQVFTEDTPAEIRGKCVLYTNPYFKN